MSLTGGGMTKRIIFLFIILFISSLNLLFSQETVNSGEQSENIEESFKITDTEEQVAGNNQNNSDTSLVTFTVWDFLRMVLVIIFVAACIYGLIFLLKKASTGHFDESDLINIISSKTVTAGKTLHIVEVGNQMMLLGISDDSITHIADITDKETYERIKLYKGENKTPTGDSFYSYLSKVISPGRKKSKKANNLGSMLDKQKKRMEKL